MRRWLIRTAYAAGSILLLVIGAVLSPWGEILVRDYLRRPTIEITLEPIKELLIDDLEELAEKQRTGSFILRRDQPLLPHYHLQKLILATSEGAVSTPTRIDLYLGDARSRAIDVKSVVRSPLGKHVSVNNTMSSVVFEAQSGSWRESTSWTYFSDASDIAGFNVYRSPFPDTGFGRVNPKLITNLSASILTAFRSDPSPSYYKVTAVSTSGMESKQTDPLELPNFPFLYPTAQNNNPESLADSEAIVHVSRTGIASATASIHFPEGLPPRCTVEVYILLKLLSGAVLTPFVNVAGAPELSVTLRGAGQTFNFSFPRATREDSRVALTLPQVRSVACGESIYLVWDPPTSDDFAGVRIFRSGLRSAGNYDDLGEEIYRGPGIQPALKL